MYIVVNINLVDVFIYDTSWSTLLSLYYTYNFIAIYYIYSHLYNYLYNIYTIIYTILY